MAIAHGSTNSTTSSATPTDITHTVTGSDTYTRVGISQIITLQDVTSVVWDPAGAAQALTKLVEQGGTVANTEIWGRAGLTPIAGGTMRITFAAAPTAAFCGVSTYTGVQQSPSVRGAFSAAAGSVTVTDSVADDWVIDCVASEAFDSVVGAGQTARWDIFSTHSGGGSDEVAVGANTVMSWTVGADDNSIVAIALIPSAGGAQDPGGPEPWALRQFPVYPPFAGSEWTDGGPAILLALQTGAFTLAAVSGSYVLTGSDAGLKSARMLAAASGTYALAGSVAALVHGLRLAANAGAHTLTGSVAGLIAARKLAAVSGSYLLTGSAAGLIAPKKLLAEGGSYILTGSAVDLVFSGAAAPVGHFIPTFRPRRR